MFRKISYSLWAAMLVAVLLMFTAACGTSSSAASSTDSSSTSNDGTYADYNARATIVAPYQPQTADYAEEIQMQVVRPFTTGTIYPCLYMTALGNALSNGWQGICCLHMRERRKWYTSSTTGSD